MKASNVCLFHVEKPISLGFPSPSLCARNRQEAGSRLSRGLALPNGSASNMAGQSRMTTCHRQEEENLKMKMQNRRRRSALRPNDHLQKQPRRVLRELTGNPPDVGFPRLCGWTQVGQPMLPESDMTHFGTLDPADSKLKGCYSATTSLAAVSADYETFFFISCRTYL